jgi:hypothetical protein
MQHFRQNQAVSPLEPRMTEDPRCCGSGTCIIDPEGRCWCGQQWNGERMCAVPLASVEEPVSDAAQAPASSSSSGEA